MATSAAQLKEAVRCIEVHLQHLGIGLNGKKTQYWCNAEQTATIQIGEALVTSADEITILGMLFAPQKGCRAAKLDLEKAYRRGASVLSSLPMAADHKAAALAAILLPSVTYCPWNYFMEAKMLTTSRKYVLAACRSYLTNGCRASPIITCALLRGHWLDPLILPCMKMLTMLIDIGPRAVITLQRAFDDNAPPTSLSTTLAAYIRKLGGKLEHGRWITPYGDSLRLLGPESSDPKDRQKHLHCCRNLLRQSALIASVTHRHEFGDFRTRAIDFEGTLKLYRKCGSGRFRAALEVVLSGGMHTRERMMRNKGAPHINCPRCGVPDTEVHRYWSCPVWNASRTPLFWVDDTIPVVTRCTGWFMVGRSHSELQITQLQRHMARVVLDSTKAFHEGIARMEQQQDETIDPSEDQNNPSPDSNTLDDDDDPVRDSADGNILEHSLGSCTALPSRDSAGGVRATCGSGCRPTSQTTGDDRDSEADDYRRNRGSRMGGVGVHTETPLRIPDFIRVAIRKLPAIPSYRRDIVSCKKCGQVGSKARIARFIQKHSDCGGGSLDAEPLHTPLTLWEKRLLEDAGISLQYPASKKRRLGERSGLHVDAW